MRLNFVVFSSCCLLFAIATEAFAQSSVDELLRVPKRGSEVEAHRIGPFVDQGKIRVKRTEYILQDQDSQAGNETDEDLPETLSENSPITTTVESTTPEIADTSITPFETITPSTIIITGEVKASTRKIGESGILIIPSHNSTRLCNENCQEDKKNYASLLGLWIAVAALGILLLAILMPMVIYLFITRKQFYLNDNNLDEARDPNGIVLGGKDTLDASHKYRATRPIPIAASPRAGEGSKKQALSPEGSPAAMSDAFGISMNSEASTSVTPTDSINNPTVFNSNLPKLTYTSSNMPQKMTKKKSVAIKKQ